MFYSQGKNDLVPQVSKKELKREIETSLQAFSLFPLDPFHRKSEDILIKALLGGGVCSFFFVDVLKYEIKYQIIFSSVSQFFLIKYNNLLLSA